MREQPPGITGAVFTFKTTNPSGEKNDLFGRMRRFAAERNWLPEITNEIELILEEWWANTIAYGLAHQKSPEVRVSIRADAGIARIELQDNGVLFDPTTLPEPDVALPAEQRPIGGFGIFMMKRLSHGFIYERAGNWNKLHLEKDLTSPVLRRTTGR